jgi:uncharacterized repeat protein (TIGR04076 family)
MRDLKVEVVEVKERCGARHKVGDTFYIRGEGTIEIPAGKRVCIFALTCPDPKGVIFKIILLK